MEEVEVGKVMHYYTKISVAAVEVTNLPGIKVGDIIHIKGRTTDFSQKVESMQIGHKEVKEAKPGDQIGIKVKERVRESDKVYVVVEE